MKATACKIVSIKQIKLNIDSTVIENWNERVENIIYVFMMICRNPESAKL